LARHRPTASTALSRVLPLVCLAWLLSACGQEAPGDGPERGGEAAAGAGGAGVAGDTAGAGGAGVAGAPALPPRPNVLLITIDTLRADHLGCYGYRLPTSPAIDALAARGVRFADTTVSTPKTWPSIATLLTGTVPRTHGVRFQNRAIRADLPVLPERFAGEGYRTGGIVTNFNLQKLYGYGRGFDQYVEAWDEVWDVMHPGEPLPADPTERLKRLFGSERMRALFQATDARFVTERALAWLDAGASAGAGGSQPFFLWLHYMDPHGPYDPPRDYEHFFEGEYPVREEPGILESPHRHTPPGADAPVTDLGFYVRRYDQEIRSLDDQLARLLAWLDERGLQGRTLVVLTADHGEALGQHGYFLEHGLQPYQECAQVPLVLVWEGVLPAGRVVEQPVGLLDLSPTLLELASLPVPDSFEGRSLAGLARALPGARGPEHVFMESGDDRDDSRPMQLSVRQGPWKLTWVRAPEDRALLKGPATELYDVTNDPGEQHERSAAEPAKAARLMHELQLWNRAHPEPGGLSQEEYLKDLPPEQIEMLKALGYVQGDAAPASPEESDRR